MAVLHERLATTLYYVADYSQAEVADFLGVLVTTIKKRLFAARRRLRERMLSMVEDSLHQQRPSREERFASTVQAIAAANKGDVRTLTALLVLVHLHGGGHSDAGMTGVIVVE